MKVQLQITSPKSMIPLLVEIELQQVPHLCSSSGWCRCPQGRAGLVSPVQGWVSPVQGWCPQGCPHVSRAGLVSPGPCQVSPGQGWVSPGQGWLSPGPGWVSPGQGRVSPGLGWVSPGVVAVPTGRPGLPSVSRPWGPIRTAMFLLGVFYLHTSLEWTPKGFANAFMGC